MAMPVCIAVDNLKERRAIFPRNGAPRQMVLEEAKRKIRNGATRVTLHFTWSQNGTKPKLTWPGG